MQSRLWFPAGQKIDVADVEAHLRHLHRCWQVAEIAYDPAYFQRSAEVLVDDGLPMVEFGQSAARMVPACQVAYEWIKAGRVIHDGSPGLTDQVLSAVPRQTDTGWRLSKGKSRRKIDGCVALVMALDRATAKPPESPPSQVWAFVAWSRGRASAVRLIPSGSRCSSCAAEHEIMSGRRARKAVRYDAGYGRARAAWAQLVAAGGVPCARRGRPIAGRFDLDHLPSGELHPSHQTCNRSAGAR